MSLLDEARGVEVAKLEANDIRFHRGRIEGDAIDLSEPLGKACRQCMNLAETPPVIGQGMESAGGDDPSLPESSAELLLEAACPCDEIPASGKTGADRCAEGLREADAALGGAYQPALLQHTIGFGHSAEPDTEADREARPSVIDVGAVWIVAKAASARTVIGIKPDLARCAAFDSKFAATGVVVFGPHDGGEAAIEVRAFAPSHGVDEDPVCGSGNGSVAVFQHRRGILAVPSYVAAQGQCVGRDGRIALSVEADGKVHVGGACVNCVDGPLKL